MGCEILVVGAGPTGLVMAVELARHGIRCRIIDKQLAPVQESRALGVQPRTLQLLEHIGIVGQFIAAGVQTHAINVHAAGQRLVRLTFDELEGRYPFVLILPQSETERLLAAHLKSLGVSIERGVELLGLTQDDAAVTVQLRQQNGDLQTLTCDWVIGSDGAHSRVRATLGLPFEGAAYPELWMLADVHIDSARLPADEVSLFTHAEGLLGLFSQGGQRFRVIADNPPLAHDGLPITVTRDVCQLLVDRRGPGGIQLMDPLWMTHFRIHRRLAPRWRQGRVFLAGDAAHIHSPAGGQGMNTGMQDAYNLAWKLAMVCRGGPREALLESYQAERLPVAEQVLRQTDRLTRTMTLTNPAARYVRNHIVTLALQFESVRDRLRRSIAELAIQYRQSPLVEEHKLRGGPLAGSLAPDVKLSAPASRGAARLMELIGAVRPVLLANAGDDPTSFAYAALAALCRDVDAEFPGQLDIHLVTRGESPAALPPRANLIRDSAGDIARRYGQEPGVYFIRPDRYIGFRGSLKIAKTTLIAYLRQILPPIETDVQS